MPIHTFAIRAFLTKWETSQTTAYIPHTKRNFTGRNDLAACGEVIASSGVTIGTGCDLDQQTYAGLLNKGVPSSLVAQFEPYLGKSGDAAILALHKDPFSISDIECRALARAVIGDYVQSIARLYDDQSNVPFADIPKEAQAVVAHLFYHLGNPTKYPRTWGFFIRQDWQAAADELRNGALWSGPYDHGRASEGRLLAGIKGVN